MNKYFLVYILITFLFPFASVLAQGAVTLSVSPTLFEMSANPGQEWKSNIRVVNVNDFDLTVYPDVVNFAPKGEAGDGLFLPIFETETQGKTLAEWINISREPIVIPRQQSMDIPFTVLVPTDANPGGHFAAILVGTKPPIVGQGAPRVQTSQMVTSLFFVRIAGDVNESGSIREFRTTKSFLTTPEATFELRFENNGNVHLQPQGDIRIYNMWGQERGVIPINRQSHFGNVLPNSIRKFNFVWTGEWALADIGRYSAVATLGYGTDVRKFVSSKTYFWVIPLKEFAFILLGLTVTISLVVWLVRLYVRRMLALAGIDVNDRKIIASAKVKKISRDGFMANESMVSVIAPLRVGMLDLRTKFQDSNESRWRVFLSALRDYWKFIIAVIIVSVSIYVLVIYVNSANTEKRAFEVIYKNDEAGAGVKVTSEELIYNELQQENSKTSNIATSSATSTIKVSIVNRSGKAGIGASTRLKLEQAGYEIVSLKADFTDVQVRTAIIFSETNETEALKLSALLNNALVSVYDAEDSADKEVITVYLGSDILEI